MKQVLNLIDVNMSTIKYDIINFSDGESHIKFTTEVNRKYPVHIRTRISSWNDLMLLMQVGDILKRMEVEFTITITYLLTMRMDRVISFNEAYTLKIIASMLNTLGAKLIKIVEPHSHKTLDLINNSTPYEMIDTWRKMFIGDKKIIDASIAIVFPDAGAKERYAGAFHTSTPIITCKKVRDVNTGQLLSFEIENPEVIENNYISEFIVIDDLCDNGGTFIGIANLLSKYSDIKRKIAVTHMVNPNGITNLSNNYDEVYFTNSYKDWGETILPNNVNIINV